MLDYPALAALAAVAQTGSFEKAAQSLGVTASAVSQRVAHLEERMGAILIERGTPCIATEKGGWLCRHVEHVGMLESELLGNLPGLAVPDASNRRVTLHIATNADSLATWFVAAIAGFTAKSDYLLNVAIDDQDHTADWLRRGRVLAAVTGFEKPVRGCRRIALGALRYCATASPEFAARYFANGVTPAALARAPALTFNQKDRLQSDWARATFRKEVACPTHWLPSSHAFVDASLAGIGWGMNPAVLVDEHLKAGRLVELMPGTPLDVPLYWQVTRLASDQLSGLTKAVTEAARHGLSVP